MESKFQSSFKRYEEKYILTRRQYECLLDGMQCHVKPDIYGKTTNCNIYYDTDNWELIRKSIEKPVYKEKLRVRSYGVPGSYDDVFIEIKKKYDKVVYKRRETISAGYVDRYLSGEYGLLRASQIGNEIERFVKVHRIRPRVYIAYDRTSYAGADEPWLRITFDERIRYRETCLDLRSGDFGEMLTDDDVILMEIKIPHAVPLWLSHLLSESGAAPTSFSKYGTYYKQRIMGYVEERYNA